VSSPPGSPQQPFPARFSILKLLDDSLKQYKTHIKQWGLDTKYIKSSEYLAMIKLQRDRANEKPPRESYFTLRGRPVDPKDITRFEKRAAKKGNPIPKKIEVDPGQQCTAMLRTKLTDG
jgi:hypothetical protein